MAFQYSKARFSIRPGGKIQAQRKADEGNREERATTVDLDALVGPLVAFAYDGTPPADATVEIHCCDEHGPLPGMPYARVWSNTRRPERAGVFCCWHEFDATEHVLAGPLTTEECAELHDMLAAAAARVDCGEADEQPDRKPGQRRLEELRS